MSTKPDTDTGWTREWPTAKDSFHWMRWIDQRYRDLPVHVNGIQVMCLFDHSYQQRGNIEGQVEFLGPISPSDFEQLIRLRKAAGDSANWIEAQTWACQHEDQPMRCTRCATRAKAKELVAALREALTRTGEQS